MEGGLIGQIDYWHLFKTLAPILVLGFLVLIFKALVNKALKKAKKKKRQARAAKASSPARSEKSASNFTRDTASQSGRVCQRCGAAMVLRSNKRTGEQFWGCSTYPKCRYTEQV